MGIRRVEDLVAWQLADAFRREVYRLISRSAGARRDFQFRKDLRSSAASTPMNIAEGFGRNRPREFRRFLDIAIGSLDEARNWVRDGIDRGYFVLKDCYPCLELGTRCRTVTVKLKRSLDPFCD
jgi:four helix bundle protein